MAKVGKIERETFEEGAKNIAKELGGEFVKCEFCRVSYENCVTTYLVISTKDKDVWFPLGSGEVCDIKSKKYKEKTNE